ncbi:hypothetical protein CPB83DRAFT_465170 [Crepidotus variabilis]|uniref:BTB domain-containing protein n=1 Tax=Crepidotus variabilis TaxID=179855 RepID=A0A9P6EC88_9AGAR|nr:hypothetical protein CPB83DRAFT_465170 [Crepidotus variabilis]
MSVNLQRIQTLGWNPMAGPGDGSLVRQRHSKYYIELVCFEVEKTLFQVPKNEFLDANSKFFDQFSLRGDEENSEPIELQDITAQAFEGLLMVLYPKANDTFTYEHWLGALDLATRWDMPEVRTKAINALGTWDESHPCTTADLIALAKKYNVKSWLRRAYVKLVRQKDLKIGDLLDYLDYETVMRIFAARSRLLENSLVIPVPGMVCHNCESGYGWRSCVRCCYQIGNPQPSCSNCFSKKGFSFCKLYCRNPVRPNGLHDPAIVGNEVDKFFSVELLRMKDD